MGAFDSVEYKVVSKDDPGKIYDEGTITTNGAYTVDGLMRGTYNVVFANENTELNAFNILDIGTESIEIVNSIIPPTFEVTYQNIVHSNSYFGTNGSFEFEIYNLSLGDVDYVKYEVFSLTDSEYYEFGFITTEGVYTISNLEPGIYYVEFSNQIVDIPDMTITFIEINDLYGEDIVNFEISDKGSIENKDEKTYLDVNVSVIHDSWKDDGIYFELYYYDTNTQKNTIRILGSKTIHDEGIYTINNLINPGTYGIVAYDNTEDKTFLGATSTTIYNTYDSASVIANYDETSDTLNFVAKTTSNKRIEEVSINATINKDNGNSKTVELDYINVITPNSNDTEYYNYSIYGLTINLQFLDVNRIDYIQFLVFIR